MQFEFLGSGTSQGVPEILCSCVVCSSDDPRDQRLRSSLRVEHDGFHVLVDVTPDFRQQCLRSGIPRLDAILLTHLHADHFMGMDDVRRFNRIQQSTIPVYLPEHMEAHFRQVFGYTLRTPTPGLYRPQLELITIAFDVIEFPGFTVTPVAVDHGCDVIRGYLFECGGKRLAYLSDCKALPPETVEVVRGADVIILGAIWDLDRSHAHHLTLTEALELAAELGGTTTYFTHITHLMGLHADVAGELPTGIQLAHDGLQVELA